MIISCDIILFVIIATLFFLFDISFAPKKSMSAFTILSGLNGALGLFSGIKGMFDSGKARRKQESLMRRAAAMEDSWYKRNYFEDYLNNSSARAAIKRVENTLRRQNEQNRAYAAVNGATPELVIARNQQGLNALENVMSNIAEQGDNRKRSVDAAHLQNSQSLNSQQLSKLSLDEKMAAQSATNGLNLFRDALMGLNWGNEE